MSATKQRIGFIGIGNMGWPMAANVRKAGYDLAVFDVDGERVARFVHEVGGTAARTAADLADRDVVITMLPNGQAVREAVASGPGGGLVAKLRRGAVLVDMSSAEPQGTRDFAKQLAPAGIAVIDAPVSGGVPRAEAGTLAIMIGADDPAVLEAVTPLLRTMGDSLFTVGSVGCGHALKALNNYVGTAAFAATAEALLVGERFGLDRARMVEVINVSTGRNFHTDAVFKQQVVSGKFGTGFALGLLAKDLKIAADLGKGVNRESPLLDLVSEHCSSARDALGASRDFTELYLAWKALGNQ